MNRQNEAGNVLFLILIAVALFAALSYAVTQTTRSGGSDASNETNTVNSTWYLGYTSSIQTALMRLVIGGFDKEDIYFTRNGTVAYALPNGRPKNIFHSEGGQVVWQLPPSALSDVNAATAAGTTPNVFLGNREVVDIGLTNGTAASADLMVMFNYVHPDVCKKINSGLSLPDPKTIVLDSAVTDLDSETSPISYNVAIVNSGGATYDANPFGTGATSALRGKREGCGIIGSNNYVYYRVVMER